MADETNLYVWHDGEVRYVSPWNGISGGTLGSLQTARASADGTHLAFVSAAKLTGYDNAGVNEVYVYDAPRQSLACASCPADGHAPMGPASLPDGDFEMAALIEPMSYSRSVTDDGRSVFFSTFDQVSPADTNRAADTYEYVDGKAQLLSAGKGSSNSYFADASADGRDVFFVTREQLVATDRDQSMDLYDARRGGRLAAEPPSGGSCAGDDCRGPSPALEMPPTPGSDADAPGGNLPDAAPAKELRVRAPARKSLDRAARAGTLSLDLRGERRCGRSRAGGCEDRRQSRDRRRRIEAVGGRQVGAKHPEDRERRQASLARGRGLKVAVEVRLAGSDAVSSMTITLKAKAPAAGRSRVTGRDR